LAGNEEKYLLECLRTGWISSEGPFIKKFEEKFATYVSREYGIAVSNGSAALDVAIQALDLKKGDEVILPTFTIISPAQSIVRAGGVPVLIDCDKNTWNMDVEQIESKITSKTKAIVVVHIYGLPVDLDPVLEICKKYNLFLVEDAAEMHGQTYKGRMCGSFGDISIFSFYPNKHITTGEGGMIVCNDINLANRCKKLRNLAFESGRRFVHNELGWNYRMTNLQAALGLAQLERIDTHIQIKRDIGNLYREGLKDLPGFQLPLERADYAENIYWIFGLVADTQELAERILEKLSEEGIGTRPFFWCMHEQPVFINMGLFKGETYPNAERIARNGFYIPSGLGLKETDISTVISKIWAAL
jgi:perosamine synthetase